MAGGALDGMLISCLVRGRAPITAMKGLETIGKWIENQEKVAFNGFFRWLLIAKLANNSNFTTVYGTKITTVTGIYEPTNITGD